jgi:oral-facial-digital syndrome 1 protein
MSCAQVVLAAIKLMIQEPDFLQQCGPELQPRLRRYIQQHPSLRKQLQQQQQQGAAASDTVEQPQCCGQGQQQRQQQPEAMQEEDAKNHHHQQQQQQRQIGVQGSCPSVDQGTGQKQQRTLQSALVAAVDMQHDEQQQHHREEEEEDDMQVDDVHPLQDHQQQQQGPKRALSYPKLDQQEGQEGNSR